MVNHTTFHVGVTYFSPKFGILVSYDESRMEYEILQSIDGVLIPTGLMEGILQAMRVDKKVLDLYMKLTLGALKND